MAEVTQTTDSSSVTANLSLTLTERNTLVRGNIIYLTQLDVDLPTREQVLEGFSPLT